MICQIQTMPRVPVDSSVDLLLKAQAGDADALNQLLARYLPRLRRWARGQMPWGLRTMLATDDLVQEAVFKALPKIGGLEVRTDRAFQFYLQGAIKNRIRDLHKRARRRPKREELPEDVREPGRSPERKAMDAETRACYTRALASLKKDERQAIVLRIEQGLDYKEIARELGKSTPDAVRMLVRRAIVRLAEKMNKCRGSKAPGNGL